MTMQLTTTGQAYDGNICRLVTRMLTRRKQMRERMGSTIYVTDIEEVDNAIERKEGDIYSQMVSLVNSQMFVPYKDVCLEDAKQKHAMLAKLIFTNIISVTMEGDEAITVLDQLITDE